MTTGLLELLKKDNDLKRWLLTDVVRQFGLFYSLVEDPMDLSMNELLEAVKEVDEKTIKSLKKDLIIPEIKEQTREKLIQECKDGHVEAVKRLARAEHELEEVNRKYDEFLAMYNKAMPNENTLISNLFTSALNQMNIMKEEAEDSVMYRKHEIESYSDVEKYIENQKKYAQREIDYYQEKADRARKQLEERESYYDTYKNLIEFINNL